MIITGYEIKKLRLDGEIDITPFDEKQLNPASYDLRLGYTYLTYTLRNGAPLDAAKQHDIDRHDLGAAGTVLYPGTLYLMHTVEELWTNKLVTVIDGKSSLGRLGISVHLTAGYGDPGFRGQYTLEVVVVHPVRVYPGMRFCQARFHTTQGAVKSYAGHYAGLNTGAIASRSWMQIQDDKAVLQQALELDCPCVNWTMVGYPASAYGPSWNDGSAYVREHHPACDKYVPPEKKP